jgi:hypothetical protein
MCVFSISSAQARMPERRNYAQDAHFAVEIDKKTHIRLTVKRNNAQ